MTTLRGFAAAAVLAGHVNDHWGLRFYTQTMDVHALTPTGLDQGASLFLAPSGLVMT